MNVADINPFNETYVTESVSDSEFVGYFSDLLVKDALPLFQDGHVIVRGTIGCGKSMLLKLLRPEIRIAYATKNLPFPVPPGQCDFLGAGVNFIMSGVLDVLQMLPTDPDSGQLRELTQCFADFLNYWLLKDLLSTLQKASPRKSVFGKATPNLDHISQMVEIIRGQDCWFGWLDECQNLSDLTTKIDERIKAYRRWVNGNADLPVSIKASKTSIGVPLSAFADALRSSGVLAPEVHVFFTLDQIEALWAVDGPTGNLALQFRSEINQMIGRRDHRVAFRVGTRRYGWNNNLRMTSGTELEDGRDFQTVDIDALLRRPENNRRLQYHQGAWPNGTPDLRRFLGNSPRPSRLISAIIKNPPQDPTRLLKLDMWSEKPHIRWREAILQTYYKQVNPFPRAALPTSPVDPLSAILLAAWGLQWVRTNSEVGDQHRVPPSSEVLNRDKKDPPITAAQEPWTKAKGSWRKERVPIAILQLTSRHQQRLLWWGQEDVLGLSGSNITSFLRLCKEIWDQWRIAGAEDSSRSEENVETSAGIVHRSIQSQAIDVLSRKMREAFARQPGRPSGGVRMRFIDLVADWLRRSLLDDTAMSNPGRNGFSLRESELQKYPELYNLIQEAVGWGDLFEKPHTSKISGERFGDPRKKYYINPILSPFFQLPETHTKEPWYANPDDILKLAYIAKAIPTSKNDEQQTNSTPVYRPRRDKKQRSSEMDAQLELPL